jgi:hypothetical protein
MSINPENPDILDYKSYAILSLGGYVPARLTNYTIGNEIARGVIDSYNYIKKNQNKQPAMGDAIKTLQNVVDVRGVGKK